MYRLTILSEDRQDPTELSHAIHATLSSVNPFIGSGRFKTLNQVVALPSHEPIGLSQANAKPALRPIISDLTFLAAHFLFPSLFNSTSRSICQTIYNPSTHPRSPNPLRSGILPYQNPTPIRPSRHLPLASRVRPDTRSPPDHSTMEKLTL